VRTLALRSIRFYQRSVSPALPPACRFEPSCSHYGYQAIERYGVLKGIWFTLRRLVRCHPFRAQSYDPLP
jgi:putative membrane protein insertion efficiency factor